MCGRYRLEESADPVEMRALIEEINRRTTAEPVKTSGDVFPADVAPVVASSRDLRSAAFAMRWGYALGDGRRVINARSETAGERPLFRDGMLRRRCAVPATQYYEWERVGSRRKTKYAIRPTDGGLFYMAGLYRVEAERPEFCILTRAPAQSIAFIHDRMPVILPNALVRDWIDPRRRADDLLQRAVLSVAFEKEASDEQLSMRFLED